MKNLAFLIAFMLFFVYSNAQTFINYAQGKPVTTNREIKNTDFLTDGSLISGSFRSDPKGESVAIDVDLTAEFKIGGIHLYFDSDKILPLREFSFQYKNDAEWINIPGAVRTDNFSSQIVIKFQKVISASAVRMIAHNVTTFGILEIQIWGTDVPSLPYGAEFEKPKPFETNNHWVCANAVYDISIYFGEVYSAIKDLQLPPLENGLPSPGKRVIVVPAEFEGTDVHHLLYLPPDWDPEWEKNGRYWPVIVEYTGNRFPTSGSTGEVEGAALGYGLSGGKFIWAVLPFVAEDHKHNEVTWWGDEKATVDYAKKNVPRICKEFGGDSSLVFLCGFSRGAIAVNYIGLFDDDIARLWCGFISHDHYDGVREWKGTVWGSPLEIYRIKAIQRLKRLNGRPVLICQNGGTQEIYEYLTDKNLAEFTFLDVPVNKIFPQIPNALIIHPHTDRWMFVDSRERRKAWKWMEKVSEKEN